MRIQNWEIRELNSQLEVSAEVDNFRLWYRVPLPYSVSRTGDPFLAAALLPAMLKGEPLEIDPGLPVSPKLLTNIATLQDIHHCWNPLLKKIRILAKTSPAEKINAGVFSFFSGGVDSEYTFLKHAEEISHVVFIHGLDFFQEDSGGFQLAVERNTRFVESFGKTLIPVEMNHYPFGYRYNISRNLSQGGALASVALLLGVSRVYVPSAYSYSQLFPLGSHPLLDPLWSTESMEVIHDGCEANRTDKLRMICQDKRALANLMVCFKDMNANCGRCVKCLRTMIPLKMLRASSDAFPSLPSNAEIRREKIDGKIELEFAKEALALESGEHDLRRALQASINRCERKLLLKEADRVLLGGLLKRTYRKALHKEGRIDSESD